MNLINKRYLTTDMTVDSNTMANSHQFNRNKHYGLLPLIISAQIFAKSR